MVWAVVVVVVEAMVVVVVVAAVARVLLEKETEGKLTSDKQDQQSTRVVFSQGCPTGQSTSTLQRILQAHGT